MIKKKPVIEPVKEAIVTKLTTEVAGSCYMMLEAEAIKYIEESGKEYRVICRDGISPEVTTDFHLKRINLTIQNGRVVETIIG